MKVFRLFFLGVSLLLCSCQSQHINNVDTSCPGYKSPDFNRDLIKQRGIAIMPVLGGEEKEQYRRPMGDALTKHLRIAFDSSNVKSTNQVITTLNDYSLSDKYTAALQGYSTTGIVPKEMVNKLGEVMNVDYLLYTRLLADREYGSAQVGDTKINFDIYEIYVQCQIWDIKLGDIVWEGKGGTATLTKTFDIVDSTAAGLANILGNDVKDGPCEDPQKITSSVQGAATSTYLAVTCVSSVLGLLIYVLSMPK